MNFSNVCRTCLSDKNLKPLFLNPKDHVQYATAVNIIMGIKVHPHDGLPQKMCKPCVDHLHNCLRFRKRCREVEEKLLKFRKPTSMRPKPRKRNSAGNNVQTFPGNTNIEVKHSKGITYVVTTERVVHRVDTESSAVAKALKSVPRSLSVKKMNSTPLEQDNTMAGVNKIEAEEQEDCGEEEQPAEYTEYDWLEDDVEEPPAHTQPTQTHGIAAGHNQQQTDDNYITPDQQQTSDDDVPLISMKKSTSGTSVDVSSQLAKAQGGIKRAPEEEATEEALFVYSEDEEDSKVGVKQEMMECDANVNQKEDVYNEGEENGANINYSEQEQANEERDMRLMVYYPESEDEATEKKYDVSEEAVRPAAARAESRAQPSRAQAQNSGGKTSKCGYCKTEFETRQELIAHVTACRISFNKQQSESARNVPKDSSEKPYPEQCKECNKVMMSNKMWQHRVLYHASSSVVCEHCGKNFKSKHRLIAHKRSKHGYEKLKCSYCEYEFASDVARKNHERRHRGEKPYVCDICGSKFHASYLLAQHKKFHRQIRLFKCDQCPAAFKTNLGLYNHKRGRHSTLLVKCELCARTYSCRHYAMKHLRYMHQFRGGQPPLEIFPLDPPQDLPPLTSQQQVQDALEEGEAEVLELEYSEEDIEYEAD